MQSITKYGCEDGELKNNITKIRGFGNVLLA
jgi:hypothetical protein